MVKPVKDWSGVDCYGVFNTNPKTLELAGYMVCARFIGSGYDWNSDCQECSRKLYIKLLQV